MTLLVLGLILWTAAHFLKRLAPSLRQSMQDRMGDGSKGIVAVAIFASLALMVIGYRGIETAYLWDHSAATKGVNNLAMLVAVALYGVGNSKSRLRSKMRHPMLWGTVVWAAAHLMVNGDVASIVLFGWIGAWALVQMQLINRAEPDYTPWEGGSVAGDVRLGIITLVVFSVIAAIHIWLGYNPFGA